MIRMSFAVWFCLLVSFLFWSLSAVCRCRYRLQRSRLLGEMALLSAEQKEKLSWTARCQRQLLRLAERFSSIGQRLPLLANQEQLNRQIALAGQPQGLTVSTFFGLRFVMLLIALLLGNFLALFGFGAMTMLVLALVGFFGPGWWLQAAARKRQEQIAADLPDFLDAMSVALKAGTSLDAALKQVVQYLSGPLGEELTRLQQEVELGVPREQAYARLIARTRCPELETLVTALLQGGRLGVPISRTFQVMAEDMRSRKIAVIKEKAAKAGPKVTLVTSLLILPGVMLSVIGLLVLHFLQQSGIMSIFHRS